VHGYQQEVEEARSLLAQHFPDVPWLLADEDIAAVDGAGATESGASEGVGTEGGGGVDGGVSAIAATRAATAADPDEEDLAIDDLLSSLAGIGLPPQAAEDDPPASTTTS
jgi:hypothetical protein